MRPEVVLNRYLATHNLVKRLPKEQLNSAVAVAGFPKTIKIGLSARVEGVTPESLEQLWLETPLIRTEQEIILPANLWQTFCPTLAPLNAAELLEKAPRLSEVLTLLEVPPFELYEMVKEETLLLLNKRSATYLELLNNLSNSILATLPPFKKELWSWPSNHKEGFTVGEEVLDLLFPVVALALPLTLERGGGKFDYHYKLFDCLQEPENIVHHYLHAYGPAFREDFAKWGEIGETQSQRMWGSIDDEEVVMTSFGVLLENDYQSLTDLREPEGVRLIGGDDPFYKIPHRSLLVQGKSHHNYFFKTSQEVPGMVLNDGKVVAGWFLRRHKESFSLQIEDIGLEFGRIATQELEAEIERLSLALGLKSDGFSVR